MKTAYLNRVLVYLKQELPEFQEMVVLKNEKIIFTVHPGAEFEPFYQRFLTSVLACTARIRNREMDLEFKVWSPTQERDFKVLK